MLFYNTLLKEGKYFMIYTTTNDLLIYIRQQMIAKHITVKELAERMNKTSGATSALLKQSNISLETLNEICKAINCQLDISIIPIEDGV